MKVFLLFLFFALMVWAGCRSVSYQGTYYPRGSISKAVISEEFPNLEACMDWGKKRVTNRSDLFECGKNCHVHEKGKLVCQSFYQL